MMIDSDEDRAIATTQIVTMLRKFDTAFVVGLADALRRRIDAREAATAPRILRLEPATTE